MAGWKLQRTTQLQYQTLVQAKIASIPKRHSYIVRLGKGGTDKVAGIFPPSLPQP
jgi:hypothetical protein